MTTPVPRASLKDLDRLQREALNDAARRIHAELRKACGPIPDMPHSELGMGAYANVSVKRVIKDTVSAATPAHVRLLIHYMCTHRVISIDHDTNKVFVPVEYRVLDPGAADGGMKNKTTRERDRILGEHLTPEEAGETRPPEPVVIRHPKSSESVGDLTVERDDTPEPEPTGEDTMTKTKDTDEPLVRGYLPEHAAKALTYLAQRGGTVTSDDGLVWQRLAKGAGVPSSDSGLIRDSLRSQGLVVGETRGKRTYKATMTDNAWKVIADINRYRVIDNVLAEWLADRGGRYRAAPRSLTKKVAESLNTPRPTLTNGIGRMVERGLLDRDATHGGTREIRLTNDGWILAGRTPPTDTPQSSSDTTSQEKDMPKATPIAPAPKTSQNGSGGHTLADEIAKALAGVIDSHQPEADAELVAMYDVLEKAAKAALAELREADGDPRNVFDHVDAAIIALAEVV